MLTIPLVRLRLFRFVFPQGFPHTRPKTALRMAFFWRFSVMRYSLTIEVTTFGLASSGERFDTESSP